MSRGVQPITKARLHCDIEKAVPGHLTAENLQKKGLKSGHGRISKTCQVKQQDHDLGHLGKKKKATKKQAKAEQGVPTCDGSWARMSVTQHSSQKRLLLLRFFTSRVMLDVLTFLSS